MAAHKKPERWYFDYLAPTEADRKRGFHVTDAGYTSIPPGSPYPPMQHPEEYDLAWHEGRVLSEFQFVYITRGMGQFESADGGVPIRAGTVFVLLPGQWHRYEPECSNGWDEYWVGLRGEVVDRVVDERVMNARPPVFQIGMSDSLVRRYLDVCEAIRSGRPGYRLLIATMALGIVAEVQSRIAAGSSAETRVDSLIQRARILISERLHAPVRMEEIASRLGVGYSWLRHAFKRTTGRSAKDYQMELRMERAKRLLQTTSALVKEIAASLGFSSPYYFCNAFRRRTGMSPTSFREAARRRGAR